MTVAYNDHVDGENTKRVTINLSMRTLDLLKNRVGQRGQSKYIDNLVFNSLMADDDKPNDDTEKGILERTLDEVLEIKKILSEGEST